MIDLIPQFKRDLSLYLFHQEDTTVKEEESSVDTKARKEDNSADITEEIFKTSQSLALQFRKKMSFLAQSLLSMENSQEEECILDSLNHQDSGI